MVASTTGEAAPRYAPSDPSLPAPWKALVDGKTGYIYYWNTETNITQYEKPFPSEGPPPLPEGHHPGSAVASSVVKSSVIPNGLMGGNGMNDMQNQRPVNSIPGNSNQSRSGGNYNGGSTENNMSGGGGGSYNGQPQHVRSGGFNSSQHGHSDRNGGRSDSGSMSNNTGPMHGSSPMTGHPKMGAPHMGRMGGNNLSSSGQGNFHSVLGNIHGNMSGNAAGEPKLASIPEPRSQQGMGPPIRMHPQVAPVHTNGAGSMVRVQSGNVSVMNMKPSPNIGFGQDPYKRSQPTAITDVDAYRRQHEVTVSGDNVPPPFMTFDSTGFPPELMKELQSAGFLAPTPIQAQSWPVALQSRDVVAIAKTGSGKTLGYLVPAFLHLARACCDSRLGPSVLVLAPTRELATQIQDEAVKFGRSSRFSTTCVYGGAPKGPQLRDLERGADIVIATPGRLNDFLEVRKVSLRQVTYLVLDEADRMLDMGFEPQIRKIVKEIPARRQTLMYTATWPKEVREIAHDLLVNPVQVNIGNSDVLSANKAITQNVEFVPPFEKQRRLEQILRGQDPGARVIIFCSTKKMCDTLARNLGRSFRAAVIHGDKSQGERDHVLAQFKQGRSPVLVATDVAARGLDIKDIRVVINYDFPTGVEDYVHRIGRTGRAGATGISYTFFSEQDGKHAKSLVKVLEDANQKVPMELRDMAGRSSHMKPRFGRYDTGGRGGRDSGRSSSFGGRGESFGMGGGGRGGLGMGGGMWGGGGGGIQDKPFGRPGNRDRFDSRDGGHERLPPDDRYNRGRDMNRRVGGGGGGGRDRAGSRSNSRSRSRSPSRSRSYDRYSTDLHQKLSSPQARRQVNRNGSPRAGGGMPYPSGLSGAGLSGPPVDLAGPIPPKLE